MPVTSRAQRTTLLAAATALALAASGCSGSADDSTTTPPMLAAAVDAHTDAPLRAAAELPAGETLLAKGLSKVLLSGLVRGVGAGPR